MPLLCLRTKSMQYSCLDCAQQIPLQITITTGLDSHRSKSQFLRQWVLCGVGSMCLLPWKHWENTKILREHEVGYKHPENRFSHRLIQNTSCCTREVTVCSLLHAFLTGLNWAGRGKKKEEDIIFASLPIDNLLEISRGSWVLQALLSIQQTFLDLLWPQSKHRFIMHP